LLLRRTYDELVEQTQTYADILASVFPGVDPDELAGKDAAELARLAVRPATSPPPRPPSYLNRGPPAMSAPPGDGKDTSNAAAAAAAEDSDTDNPSAPDRTWDESIRRPPSVVATDDNNAISVATDQTRRPSFLGVTSVRTALRAIFRVYPAAREHAVLRAREWTALLPAPAPPATEESLGPLKEQRCVDFYFENIHPVVPFLDEEHFRATLRSGRQDASWLGLLYVVLALGSIASGSDTLHELYYRKAQSVLNLETLGTGNLESLQALCLLGGFYLHYRNSPNTAFALLGAANRMAIALGLHREEAPHHVTAATANAAAAAAAAPGPRAPAGRPELHRRTWWGLFCLDTWMSMSLGRPSCGRWDPATMDVAFPAARPDDRAAAVLRANCALCLICNRVQDRFARPRRPLSADEALAFDAELRAWYDGLPPPLLSAAPEAPRRFSTAGEFVRQRFLNVRLMLFRAVLYRLVLSDPPPPPGRPLAADEAAVLERARDVTAEAVEAIALYWVPNRLHVWTSAWYLFQACLVPLLCLAVHRAGRAVEPPEKVASWRASVAKALEAFAEMRSWMRPSDRTPDIVAAVFEAVTAEALPAGPAVLPVAYGTGLAEGDMGFAGWYDEQWAPGLDLDWDWIQLNASIQGGTFPPP